MIKLTRWHCNAAAHPHLGGGVAENSGLGAGSRKTENQDGGQRSHVALHVESRGPTSESLAKMVEQNVLANWASGTRHQFIRYIAIPPCTSGSHKQKPDNTISTNGGPNIRELRHVHCLLAIYKGSSTTWPWKRRRLWQSCAIPMIAVTDSTQRIRPSHICSLGWSKWPTSHQQGQGDPWSV